MGSLHIPKLHMFLRMLHCQTIFSTAVVRAQQIVNKGSSGQCLVKARTLTVFCRFISLSILADDQRCAVPSPAPLPLPRLPVSIQVPWYLYPSLADSCCWCLGGSLTRARNSTVCQYRHFLVVGS
jgi:hypothetical protein